MMVKVKRMTLHDYNQVLSSWGHRGKWFKVMVPSSEENAQFAGCFMDDKRQEVAVAWPVDRPEIAQSEYAAMYRCGFPVDEFEIKETMNGKGH